MAGSAEIHPVETETDRPFWSVMIPTYEPDPSYLAEALESVLAEDPGAQEMQVQLVDDHSEDFHPREFLGERLTGRVEWHRQTEHSGIGGNWNTCLRLARGVWVHLLHQDDLVRAGFYQRLREAIRGCDEAGAIVTQLDFIDRHGIARRSAFPEKMAGGVLEDWVEHVFVRLRIQGSAIVVRRATYELLGGFDESYAYTLDWNMWQRLAFAFPILYEPRARACWREHDRAATRRLMISGQNMREVERCIAEGERILPPDIAADTARRARLVYTRFAVDNAIKIARRTGHLAAAMRQLGAARRLSSTTEVARYVWSRVTGIGQDPSE